MPVFLKGREIATSLCEAAGDGTDLVVMATHGRGPLARLWRGSIADVLTQRLSVPLLLVRGYNAPADLTGDPFMRHVLIPLDGSEFAEQVLQPAIALGGLQNANHTLLRVVSPETEYSVGYGGRVMQQPVGERRREAAMNYLRRVVERRELRTERVSSRVILNWQPAAKAILHYSQTHDADLIALTTRGRAGLSRLIRGSVVNQVVRGASVPVLVVRASCKEDDRGSDNDLTTSEVVVNDLVPGDTEDRQRAGTVYREFSEAQ